MEGEADAEVWRQSEGATEIEVDRAGDEVLKQRPVRAHV